MSKTISDLSCFDRYKIVCENIKRQFPSSNEANLCFAVVQQAILDAFVSKDPVREERSAVNFLKWDMLPAEICGVDADWIRLQLSKHGMKIHE